MKKIALTQGKFALVDDEDFEYLNQWKWIASNTSSTRWYAMRRSNHKSIYMHRVLRPNTKIVDHINGDGLDNQKRNLRPCNTSENNMNKIIASNNTSGYKGVSWSKRHKKWIVKIQINKKQFQIGLFSNIIEAARSYNKKAKELFGSFARLNDI